MTKQKYYEVEVIFNNPTWTSKGNARTKDKILMTPESYEEELRLIKQKISAYSKIRKIRVITDVKKWRGF